MAIPYRLIDSGSKRIHTNSDLEEESYIGLSMPLRNSELTGSVGYFESTNYTIDAIKENVKNILVTQKNERIFRPNMGINWNSYLFSQLNQTMLNRLTNEIRQAILNWMPFLNINQIETVRDEESDDNIIYVRIIIQYKNEMLPINYAIPLGGGGNAY